MTASVGEPAQGRPAAAGPPFVLPVSSSASDPNVIVPAPMLKPVTSSAPQREWLPAEWMLASKLQPPPQRITAIARDALLDRLDRAVELPLTVMLAPPGFGKTTLLAQWHQRLRQRIDLGTGWLSLDEDDSDPGRFVAYLGQALSQAGAEPSPALQALMQRWQNADLSLALGALVATLRTAPRRLVVILDDYDRVRGRAIDELLGRLIEHAGTRLHLLLATRRRPSLPLSRLAVHGNLEHLLAQDLALDDEETRALLGPGVPAQAAQQLRQRTEGWPVALHLAALWMDGSAQRRDEVANFSGRSASFAAYLAEQVVNDLDPPLREFLLQTSLLDTFNASLADAVRQRDDSGALLARLDHFHGLLVPLDSEHEWFRYHPLFAEYLRLQLERSAPGLPAAMHLRAAHWFSVQGRLLESVRHALRAGDAPRAADYIARAGSWQLLLEYGPAEVRALLRQFGNAYIRDTPALNLTQAYLHMKLGEFGHAQTLLERFRDFPAEVRAPFERDYTVVIALLRHLLDEICANPQGVAQIASQASALDQDDFLGRGTLLCIAATSALGRGQFAQAEQLAGDGERMMRQAGSEVGATYALIHRGQSHFYRGRLDEAEAIYLEAQALAERHVGTDPVLRAVCRCLLARLQCEHGRYHEAADLLEPALAFIEQHDGWLDIFAAGYETALALARQRDRSGRHALALLDGIDELARRRRLSRLADLACAWRLETVLTQQAGVGVELLVTNAGGEAAFNHALARPQNWRQLAALGFALAHWHGASGRSHAALAVLRAIEERCHLAGNRHHLARAQARIALVLQQRGQIDDALPYLRHALDYIAHNRAWLVMTELGMPAKAMLRLARQHDSEIGPGTTRALTIQALLDKLHHEDEAASELFSGRELEVLAELARGSSNKHIARQLNLSENTVKFHLKNLYRKLDADNREAALAMAVQRGLVRL